MIQVAPLDWVGTLPEWLVYQVLTQLKIEFEYQSRQLGGRLSRGGAVLDFHIPDRNLGINIASMYWHYARPDQVMNDRLQREVLESQGLTMVYIDELDVLRNARYYVDEALQFRDHSLMTRG